MKNSTSLPKKNGRKQLSPGLIVDGNSLSTLILYFASKNHVKCSLSEKSKEKIAASRRLLDDFVEKGRIIYGVNTGLGGFVNWLIPLTEAQTLQENLIGAVATNVGPYLDDQIVRASMLARINSLARGNSAISIENCEKLVKIYNSDILPCIPSKGSLGASGDLGPLACIALVATGKWKAKYKGKILPGDLALKKAGIEPMTLNFKEGLSLINGTSVMTGLASIIIEKAIMLTKMYDLISCLSFEGLGVKKKPFHPIVHREKPHRGQYQTALNIWTFLEDSKMVIDEDSVAKKLSKELDTNLKAASSPIEDAYSVRCTPQILGPIKDSLLYIKSVINNELNSSNDNPLILEKENDVFHNGHFHGQYISMAMDHLSIAMTTLSNLSDRRIDRFMDFSNSNGLPPFLCKTDPGLRFGLMGGQFMATSVTAENRSLCSPVSIQTLTSTGDFQDIVSMGLIAARRAKEIYENTVYVVAFELLAAAQAVEIRGIDFLGSRTRRIYEIIKEYIPRETHDIPLTNSIEHIAEILLSGSLLQEMEDFAGEVII